ncbi:MAG: hypothetical protein AB7U81_02820 [Thiohalomonadaceae bacterium]
MTLDPVGLGSLAARLSYRATSAWAFSASAFGTGEEIDGWGGTAVSAMFVQPMGTEAFTAAAGWGRTSMAGEIADSFLLVGSFHYAHHQFFARAASVSHNEESGGARTHPVTAGTLGYTYARRHGRQEIGIGVSITAFKVPPALEQAYGELPLAWQLHLSVQAASARESH